MRQWFVYTKNGVLKAYGKVTETYMTEKKLKVWIKEKYGYSDKDYNIVLK